MKRLLETFVGASIVGSDAFLRSSPAEISSFKQHMEAASGSSGGPYDVIIDGLNVAAKRYPGRTSTDRVQPENGREFPFHRTQLAAVLDYFYAKKKKILVVGKPPIAALLSDQWKRRIDYFVVNSTSQDDLFVVYAALLSGPHCHIVSEDQYKDHKKHLPADAKKLFVTWQGWRQISFVRLENGMQPVFKMPAPHRGNAQRSKRGWHLPLVDRQEALLTYNVTTKWLCIDAGRVAHDSEVMPALSPR